MRMFEYKAINEVRITISGTLDVDSPKQANSILKDNPNRNRDRHRNRKKI
jgi:hypothetical protein